MKFGGNYGKRFIYSRHQHDYEYKEDGCYREVLTKLTDYCRKHYKEIVSNNDSPFMIK